MRQPNMSYSDFLHYIKILKTEFEFREKLYTIGVFDIITQLHTFDICVELLEIIFNDKTHRLSEWIYEEDFGEVNHISTKDIYEELIKEGDDLSQSEEC